MPDGKKRVTIIIKGGKTHFIYSPEAMKLTQNLGTPEIRRASHVEPDPVTGCWTADLGPVGGPVLGPFPPACRDEALAAEAAWLLEHHILGRPCDAAADGQAPCASNPQASDSR